MNCGPQLDKLAGCRFRVRSNGDISEEVRYKTIGSTKRYIDFFRQSLTARPPRVAYVGGFFGHDNLGDEALYDAVESLFNRCSLLKYPRKPWVTHIAGVLPRVHCAILGGGTLINRIESWRLLAERCFEIFPASFVFGTGVAHPEFWSSQLGWKDTLKEWKAILGKCRYIGVRGPLSAQLLADAGLGGVEVIGDPALAFAVNSPPDDGSYIPDSLGLNISQADGRLWGTEDHVLREYISLAKTAKKAGWRVKWFVVYPPDLEITRKAAELSGTSDEIHKIYTDVGEYLELVRTLSTFVGMKLHATALACCAYVPSVMLEYRPKCRDFMQSIGQDEVTLRTDTVKAGQAWEIVSAMNLKRPEAARALYDAIRPLATAQRDKANQLVQTMIKA